MSSQKILNLVFVIQLILFCLIATGILPRELALYLGLALIIYFLTALLDDNLVFFVRSIPLFLALPVATGFDNFNTWRILAGIIFLKWLWLGYQKSKTKNQNDKSKFKKIFTFYIIILHFDI